MTEIILITLAICIDSFVLGITYGIKKIRISKMAVFIINLVNIVVLGVSIYFASVMRQYISQHTSSLISCLILVGLGIFFMLEGFIKYKIETTNDCRLAKFYIPKLGIIIDIALDYTKADLDFSGNLDLKGALYLGFVLSIDALGIGFGLSLGGINYLYFLPLVLFSNIISILYGQYLGTKITHYNSSLKTSLLPGSILIFSGLLKWL
ncbi:manganese efflux pump [Alkaliphilus oremlandii]|uniref:Sporulation protein YtaF n=1 Tax=Alkaliphilus oremlandii (strain OhILAs) TaxID=350688 RepID=A8ML00_ALKOO|nr:manganese efflux pump [Alkaliphilus oremlandii]ABW17817.1 sporulation protein YtaF [Alkaliphilus oremlandii OhILAs]